MQDSGGADTCGWVILMPSAVAIVFSWSAWDKTVTPSPLLHWTSHLRVGYEEKSAAYTKLTPVGMIFPAFFARTRNTKRSREKFQARDYPVALRIIASNQASSAHHEQIYKYGTDPILGPVPNR